MPIEISCSNCGKSYGVAERFAGRTATCRVCRALMKVPGGPAQVEESPPDISALEELHQPASSQVIGPSAPPASVGAVMPWGDRSIIPDGIAQIISGLLVLALIGGWIWLGVAASDWIIQRSTVPPGLQTRLHVFLGTLIFFGLLFYFAVIVPLVILAAKLACNWTNWTGADGVYLRAAGAAALPSVLVAFLMIVGKNYDGNFVPMLWALAPILLIVALKELLALRWSATAVAAGMLLIAAILLRMIAPEIGHGMIAVATNISSLDRESIAKYAQDHPDEVAEARAAHAQPAQDSAPARPDPNAGKIEPYLADLAKATSDATLQTREEIQAARAALAPKLAECDAAFSPLYLAAKQSLAELEKAAIDAPSETPPQNLFTPIDPSPLPIAKAGDDEFSADAFAFKTLRIRPLKDSKIDLKGFDERESKQRWKLSDAVSLELRFAPLGDANQQRPWIADRDVISQIAAQKKLLAIIEKDKPEIFYGRLDAVPWTRCVGHDTFGYATRVTYVSRLAEAWLIATATSETALRKDADLADKFVQGIAVASAGEKLADVYDPARIVERFADFRDDPSPIIRAAGAPGIAALRAYVAHMGEKASYHATQLLYELAPQPLAEQRQPSAASPVAPPPDLATDIATLKDSHPNSEKSAALRRLAATQPDSAHRDDVAAVLEEMIVTDAAFIADDAADALRVWWRPQTVTTLLPLLDENVSPQWKRTRAIKVLSKTGDKRAVYPIVRWIIRAPEEVVPALKEMGPIAEDDVVKLLRERDPSVRTNAARILEEIGGQKSLSELRRAAGDLRDATAAAAAKSAAAAVQARLKQAKAATSQAATRSIKIP